MIGKPGIQEKERGFCAGHGIVNNVKCLQKLWQFNIKNTVILFDNTSWIWIEQLQFLLLKNVKNWGNCYVLFLKSSNRRIFFINPDNLRSLWLHKLWEKKENISHIHPSIKSAKCLLGSQVAITNPATVGWRLGTPWTGHQSVAGPHTHTQGQFRDTNQSTKHVFGLWEDAGEPGKNLHMHRENM